MTKFNKKKSFHFKNCLENVSLPKNLMEIINIIEMSTHKAAKFCSPSSVLK